MKISLKEFKSQKYSSYVDMRSDYLLVEFIELYYWIQPTFI